MTRLGQSRVGKPGKPTLTDKEASDFRIMKDAERIVGMRAGNEFNPEVNQVTPNSVVKSYEERARERAQTRKSSDILKKTQIPLGHVPSPSSEKMQQLAQLSGGGIPHPVFEAESMKPQSNPFKAPPPEGVGASYEVNRAMANGKFDGPVSLRQAKEMEQKKGLSPETQQALMMAQENMDKTTPSAEEQNIAKAAKDSTVLDAPQTSTDRSELDRAESVIVKAQDSRSDLFDFDQFPNIRNTLMGTERRKKIESRLTPLDITEMIMKKELRQTIPVIPGKLEFLLRTYTQAENLWCLRYIYDFSGSPIYTQELLSTCRLACCLLKVNEAFMPEHRINLNQHDETIDKAAFEKKLATLKAFPIQLIADMSVQLMWFEDRVNNLFSLDALKNG